jgi:hypothetical protein
MILRLQRDEYLPLRVIRQRLDGSEDGQGKLSVEEDRADPDEEVV